MRQVLLAGKEAEEGTALLGGVVADGPAQHWIAGLEGIEDGALRDGRGNFELHFGADLGQRAQMVRKDNSDHIDVNDS